MVSIAVAVGVPFTLLSVAYEMLFFAAYSVLLLLWVGVEVSSVTVADRDAVSATPPRSVGANVRRQDWMPQPPFRLDHMRQVAQVAMLMFLSFFGTGNIASISSFEISST